MISMESDDVPTMSRQYGYRKPVKTEWAKGGITITWSSGQPEINDEPETHTLDKWQEWLDANKDHPSYLDAAEAVKVLVSKIELGLTPEHMTRAAGIMEDGRVMDHMLKAYGQCHVGDTEIPKVCIAALASQQDTASQGIYPSVTGERETGKTSAFRAFMHLIPHAWRFEGSASDKAFFYVVKRSGMVLFLDDVTLSPELLGTIKRAKSNFQQPTQHATVIDKVGAVQVIPARTMFLGSSVQTAGDPESVTRDFNISISNKKEDYEAFDKWLRDKATVGEPDMPESEDVLVSRAIVSQLKEHMFKVIIDFAPYLKMQSETHGKRATKDFWDFIRAVAIFNLKRRPVVEEVDGVLTIRATVADMEEANKIFDCNRELKKLALSKDELEIVKKIRTHAKNGELPFTDLRDMLKMPSTTLYYRLFGRHDNGQNVMGIIDKVAGIDKADVTEYEGDISPGSGDRLITKRGRPTKMITCTLAADDPLGSYDEGKFYLFDTEGWTKDPKYRPE
jgi:hypothetical protein